MIVIIIKINITHLQTTLTFYDKIDIHEKLMLICVYNNKLSYFTFSLIDASAKL